MPRYSQGICQGEAGAKLSQLQADYLQGLDELLHLAAESEEFCIRTLGMVASGTGKITREKIDTEVGTFS